MPFQSVSPAGTSTSTQFAGDVQNKISQLLGGIDIAATDATNKPTINTETRFYSSALRIFDNDLSHEFYFDTSAVNIAEDKALLIPALTNSSDTFLFLAQAATPTNKTINIDTNVLAHSTTNAAGDLLKGDGSKFVRLARGTAGQLIRVNAGGTDIEWYTPSAGTWDPNAIETITNKTINATNNTIIDTSQATADLLKNNGTKFVRMAKGTALQVLRVNSGGTDLEWGTPAGGGDVSTTSSNTFGDFDQIFRSGRLDVRNPANTYSYSITGSAITGNIAITLPLLTSGDTLVTEAFASTLTNKTLNATNNTITDTSTAAGDLFVSSGTKFLRKAKGTALQVLRTNSGATNIEWASLDNERVGKSTASSGSTTYIIAHGLGSTPAYAFVDCSSHAIARTFVVDATNITVTFVSAPPSGTVTIYWRVVAA